MKKLYDKSEVWFAVICIVIYSIGQSLAASLNKMIGIDYSANAVLNIVLTVILFLFIRKNGLMSRYGLCRTSVSARKFLWFIPLAVMVSHNLWNGFAVNLRSFDLVCYLCYMLCVGFVEEILFRGLLFRGIAKDNYKLAVVISSVTFGLGHLVNMINGVNDNIVEGLCQVAGAIAVGFLFVTIFNRSQSLIPCIVTHSLIDMVSAFARMEGLTSKKRIIISAVNLVVAVGYTVVLLYTLPNKDGVETGENG